MFVCVERGEAQAIAVVVFEGKSCVHHKKANTAVKENYANMQTKICLIMES